MQRAKAGNWAPPWRWGIFLRRPCQGLFLEGRPADLAPMASVYEALKRRGFRETYWQFVYPDQIGGLVKTPRGRLYEYHVRFFGSGMIYAEFEIGRSMILHFLLPRCYLNDYLISIIRRDLTGYELSYLARSVAKYKDASGKTWQEWSSRSRLLTPLMKRRIRTFHSCSDWRVLFVAMAIGSAAVIGQSGVILPIVAALLLVIYLIAPRRS